MSGLEELRRRLAATLVERGDVKSEFWRDAVERVARHVLVPRFYERVDGGYRLIDRAVGTDRERWAKLVYDPLASLVTEYDPVSGYPTSSATMPSIVLQLLKTLDPGPSQRVLDVGTASGYSTALLCERVGSENVTSIDLGESVTELARARLAEIGYTPTIVCGDGFSGHLPNARYDRVLSMVTINRVPTAWIDQTRPGGVIVATLPEMTVRLVREADGSATGRFVHGFGFMWMRGHAPTTERDVALVHLVHGPGIVRSVGPSLGTMLTGKEVPAFWGMARLVLMPYDVTIPAGDGQTGLVAMTDRSWVLIDSARERVTQGGPRRLWDEIEELYALLKRCGCPARDRFGLTVSPDRSQYVWLDDPDGEYRWEL